MWDAIRKFLEVSNSAQCSPWHGRSLTGAGGFPRLENRMLNPWLAMTFQAARLTWEAQGVMALRLMKLAGGNAAAQSEANGMSAEKVAALADAQPVAAPALRAGRNGARTGNKVPKKKVRANKRKLSR
jgi:hypothetical protein